MDDGTGEKAEDEHDGGGVDENPAGVEVVGFGDLIHDAGDPSIGADFCSSQWHHDEDQEEEERTSEALGIEAEGDDEGDADADKDVFGCGVVGVE